MSTNFSFGNGSWGKSTAWKAASPAIQTTAAPASASLMPNPSYGNYNGGYSGSVKTGSPAANPTPNVSGYGMNVDTANLALGGIQTLAGIWQAYQAQQLAEKSLKVQTGFANANLANSTQSYNTHVADIARTRYSAEDLPMAQQLAWQKANSLPDRTIA